jgi:hypothetical protein
MKEEIVEIKNEKAIKAKVPVNVRPGMVKKLDEYPLKTKS